MPDVEHKTLNAGTAFNQILEEFRLLQNSFSKRKRKNWTNNMHCGYFFFFRRIDIENIYLPLHKSGYGNKRKKISIIYCLFYHIINAAM